MRKWIYAALIMLSCQTIYAQMEKMKSVSTPEFEEAITKSEVQLIDVRTPEEYQSGHIRKAINIDVKSSSFSVKILTLNKTIPVAVYCRSGMRSKAAAEILLRKGYTVIELNKGILDWMGNGKSVTK